VKELNLKVDDLAKQLADLRKEMPSQVRPTSESNPGLTEQMPERGAPHDQHHHHPDYTLLEGGMFGGV
jgi:hypothetical protein